MSAPAKYLFEIDFAAGGKSANTVPLTEHKAKLADAEARGYRNGFTAAQTEAAADTARRLGVALEKISGALTEITQGLKGVEGRLEAEAVEVAAAIARKLAPELLAREPFAEIAALVTNCLRDLTTAPHVVVRVGEAIYPQARDQLDAIAGDIGFAGRLVVLAEAGMADNDCRVEWADGGMTRDRAKTEALIAEYVNRYLSVRRVAAPAT